MYMMIVQLFVFMCAYALGAADDHQSYNEIDDSLRIAFLILNKNVLSLHGNVTSMNDPRRQYTDIIYVVQNEAQSEDSCLLHDYYGDYQKNINKSLPFAVAHPESVIQLTNKTINDVIDHIKPIQEVIQSVMMYTVSDGAGLADNLQIDKAVDEKVKTNGEKCESSKQVYLAAGLFATQLIKDDANYFDPNTQNLSAHHFIINGAEKLNLIVMALKNLYQVMYGPSC